jgi:hypothetical protein
VELTLPYLTLPCLALPCLTLRVTRNGELRVGACSVSTGGFVQEGDFSLATDVYCVSPVSCAIRYRLRFYSRLSLPLQLTSPATARRTVQ